MKQYEWLTTVRKATITTLKSAIPLAVAYLIYLSANPEAVTQLTSALPWLAAAIPPVLGAWRAVENYRKNAGTNGKPLWEWSDLIAWIRTVATCVIVAAVLCGCTTVRTSFDEPAVDADGAWYDTHYEAMTRTLFAKADTSNHVWNYRWGGDENVLGTGQNAAGMDSTEMARTIAAITPGIVQGIVQGMVSGLIPTPAGTASTAATATSGIAGFLADANRILGELEKLKTQLQPLLQGTVAEPALGDPGKTSPP
jgi:hypothetical protein